MKFILVMAILSIADGQTSQVDKCVQKLALNDNCSLEVKVDPEKDDKVPSRLILKAKGKPDFELARWTRDYALYRERGWEIPSDGLFGGLAISKAVLKGDVIVAHVVYRRKLFVIAGDLRGRLRCEPVASDLDPDAKPIPDIVDVKRGVNSIEVMLIDGKKISMPLLPLGT
jgi:hypothetical protein